MIKKLALMGISLIVLVSCAKKEAKMQEEIVVVPEEEVVAKEDTIPPVEEVVKIPLELSRIHFDFDKYDIRLGDTKILEKNAEGLKAYPEVRARIEGHCDERGTNEYNLALGEKRAAAARDYLIRLGIEKERISVISFGEENPLVPGHNESAWAKNRRAEFAVLK
ncbi:peptidoglycan-associated lipoprotein [candidate division WOR-3 bacterium JGI_Cruoil_03_44_89]|uniref:Peptidoglycan-associated lipoprotein n=1 Tax=candidate division WOR-3 bacterium JGI_Cruoil_03_44_89 TaxID=1973748 RepID=A0A235BU84_UNCW3|nr:MAG: peptidoglycan-associated lipoprotein [candidate division WOR-3 bacterium JGI_Cruoil_03_44_89]